jgi:hypothetical protein
MASENLMPDKFTFIDWEGRPAVISGAFAYAVISENGSWEPINLAEVVDSGRPISEATFSNVFPNADLSTIPSSPSPEDKLDTQDTTTMSPLAKTQSS